MAITLILHVRRDTAFPIKGGEIIVLDKRAKQPYNLRLFMLIHPRYLHRAFQCLRLL